MQRWVVHLVDPPSLLELGEIRPRAIVEEAAHVQSARSFHRIFASCGLPLYILISYPFTVSLKTSSRDRPAVPIVLF